MRRRALTLMEVMLASGLLLYAVFVFLSVYSTSARSEVHSQNRTLAAVLGENLLEEVEAHRYGSPAPVDWGLKNGLVGEWTTVNLPMVVDGRPVSLEFHIQRRLRNGAMVGQSSQNETYDVFTGVISWREGQLTRDTSGPYGNAYYADDNRHLVVQVPAWY